MSNTPKDLSSGVTCNPEFRGYRVNGMILGSSRPTKGGVLVRVEPVENTVACVSDPAVCVRQ